MARGMAAGEPIVSQAQTQAFDEGYERTFAPGPKARGRFIWDPAKKEMVPISEYVPPVEARNAPIMVDRFYENTKATDGTDIGSRRKHRAYMKEHGLTTADDFGSDWKRAQARRDAIAAGQGMPSKTRREVLERAFYKLQKP